ncbi:MAG TPA: methyltransferase domain-containing protein, partial [Ktedonobacterales bacterium]
MPQKFDPRMKDQLLSDERQKLLQPAKLLRSLGLRAGDTLADIGCGPGFFTLPAAEIVGVRGLVYAADIQGDMLSAVKTRATEANLTNVQVIKSSDTEVPIRAASVDMALLAFTLHEIEPRARFLHRVSRLLKPTGKLVIIEWEKQSDAPSPPANPPLTAEDAIKDAEAAGL